MSQLIKESSTQEESMLKRWNIRGMFVGRNHSLPHTIFYLGEKSTYSFDSEFRLATLLSVFEDELIPLEFSFETKFVSEIGTTHTLRLFVTKQGGMQF